MHDRRVPAGHRIPALPIAGSDAARGYGEI